MKPIDKKLVQEASELATQLAILEEKIIERIEYVLKTIFSTFGNKLDYWYFDGAEEGEVGDLWKHYNDKDICVTSESSGNKEMAILDKYNQEWYFEGLLPTRWLFEDFEQELIDGKRLFKEKEEKESAVLAAKKLQKMKADNRLIESAKKKLSKEELKALKLV